MTRKEIRRAKQRKISNIRAYAHEDKSRKVRLATLASEGKENPREAVACLADDGGDLRSDAVQKDPSQKRAREGESETRDEEFAHFRVLCLTFVAFSSKLRQPEVFTKVCVVRGVIAEPNIRVISKEKIREIRPGKVDASSQEGIHEVEAQQDESIHVARTGLSLGTRYGWGVFNRGENRAEEKLQAGGNSNRTAAARDERARGRSFLMAERTEVRVTRVTSIAENNLRTGLRRRPVESSRCRTTRSESRGRADSRGRRRRKRRTRNIRLLRGRSRNQTA